MVTKHLLEQGVVFDGKPEAFERRKYRELGDLQNLSVRAMKEFGMSVDYFRPLGEGWEEHPASADLIQSFRDKFRDSASGFWGWCDPVGCLLLPLYRKALSEAGLEGDFHICVSDPLRLAEESHGQFTGTLLHRVVGLWQQYTLSALHGTRGLSRRVWLSPGEWMVDHESARRTYELCAEAAKDPEGFNQGRFDDEVARQFSEMATLADMVSAVEQPEGYLILSIAGERQPAFRETFFPMSGWQALRAEITPRADASVIVDLYQQPCYIWMRKITWRTDSSEKSAKIRAGRNGELEDLYGCQRLTVMGGGALIIDELPSKKCVLQIEFLVQSGQVVLRDIAHKMQGSLEKKYRR